MRDCSTAFTMLANSRRKSWCVFDLDAKKVKLAELQRDSEQSDFWDNSPNGGDEKPRVLRRGHFLGTTSGILKTCLN
jgi:hypothetical protein